MFFYIFYSLFNIIIIQIDIKMLFSAIFFKYFRAGMYLIGSFFLNWLLYFMTAIFNNVTWPDFRFVCIPKNSIPLLLSRRLITPWLLSKIHCLSHSFIYLIRIGKGIDVIVQSVTFSLCW